MLWDATTAKWREQPAYAEPEDRNEGIITARLWEFGRVCLVDDQRPEPSFSDTGKHWAVRDIRSLAAKGVANGFPDGTFGPDQRVTRAQFVTFLASALQWPVPANTPGFKDKIPAWAGPAVAKAFSRGVITGYPDGTFAPEARITRSEMAVMISRALNLEEVKEPEDPGGKDELKDQPEPVKYKDFNSIPEFAWDAVAKVTAAGLFQGSDGLFRPLDGATRAETAAVVNRMLGWWVK
ncbi:MAG: Endoglucanase precursor [Firmicutes bacterium ADurb.Bin456]|nr:MAG: Endoglucanase precursor [Firmicutes bacterium ADurb.Bin456]